METLVANAKGKWRQEEWLGKKYLVVPVRMIVPGVLNGNKGKLYYPPEEIAKNPGDWNGIPIVAPNHPTVNGKPVSARHPKIIEEWGIGWVFNTHADSNLDAEGWVDIERANKVDPRIVKNIKANKPFELSTGLFPSYEKAPEGSVDNQGRSYEWTARDYRPDHLAFLMDLKGACSLADGCGVLINTQGDSNMPKPPDAKSIWQRLGEVLGITSNQASFSDRMETLSAQLRERCKEDQEESGMSGMYIPMPYIIDMMDDSVIYQYDGSVWKLGYTTGKNDTVSLSEDDPVEVQRVTSYNPVGNTEGNQVNEWVTVDVTNAYANEHAARVEDPDKFLKNTFRRKELGKGISAIMGKKEKGGPMMIQAFRFDAKKFTADQARKWIEDHHYKMMEFAAASGKPTNNQSGNTEGDSTIILPGVWNPITEQWEMEDTMITNASMTKKEGNDTLTAEDYAYVPDPQKPSTWKLRIDDGRHVAAAVAAIGKGYRGQKVDIPASDLPAVKKKLKAAWKKFYPNKASSEMPEIIRNSEGDTTVTMTAEQRKPMVDSLVANCNCSHNVPWKGKDAATLNTLSDDLLATYFQWNQSLQTQQNPPVAQPVQQPQQVVNQQVDKNIFTDPSGNRFMINPVTNQLVPVTQTVTQTPAPVGNQGNQQKPKTTQEWYAQAFKDAPPEALEVWNTAQEAFSREKNHLIEQLVTNMTGEVREQAVKIYSDMPIVTLRVLATAAPQQHQEQPVTNWQGAATTTMLPVQQEPLLPPVYDWSKK